MLTVRSNFSEGRLVNLGVALHRPNVTRLFLGKTPEEVVKTVPLLYAVCAHAQRAAAQTALDAARGRLPGSPESTTGLWTEMLHENLWRLLLDWPVALGLPAAKDAFVAWRTERHGDTSAELTEQLCNGLVPDLSAQCLARIPLSEDAKAYQSAWMEPKVWLQHCLTGTGQMPTLGPPSSVRAAYQARIVQLREAASARASQRPYPVASASASASASGWGVAQVVTARGVLTHAAQVVDGRVTAYRVWAPTDIYFSDSSALLALLAHGTYESAQQARSALALAVLALDPCVPFEVELSDA